jgi:metal-dependent amidase/aminoacylase/carboxypeptidase family protein
VLQAEIYRSAHASAAPWEAKNALDAAFLAYSNVSVLRQQIKPDHRVHGIVEGKNWAANSEHCIYAYVSIAYLCVQSYPTTRK